MPGTWRAGGALAPDHQVGFTMNLTTSLFTNIRRYAGTDQWQLEGVQPGGIRSGGMYGLWSHVDHDDHGPMGPFYYAPVKLCNFSFD